MHQETCEKMDSEYFVAVFFSPLGRKAGGVREKYVIKFKPAKRHDGWKKNDRLG